MSPRAQMFRKALEDASATPNMFQHVILAAAIYLFWFSINRLALWLGSRYNIFYRHESWVFDAWMGFNFFGFVFGTVILSILTETNGLVLFLMMEGLKLLHDGVEKFFQKL